MLFRSTGVGAGVKVGVGVGRGVGVRVGVGKGLEKETSGKTTVKPFPGLGEAAGFLAAVGLVVRLALAVGPGCVGVGGNVAAVGVAKVPSLPVETPSAGNAPSPAASGRARAASPTSERATLLARRMMINASARGSVTYRPGICQSLGIN